jgi:hypothetical protein
MDWMTRVQYLQEYRSFSLCHKHPKMALRSTQPPTQWIPGDLSVGVKEPGCEADRYPLSSAEVKSAWSYTSTPSYVFMAWCFIKTQGQFYLSSKRYAFMVWYFVKHIDYFTFTLYMMH